jgi:hypothetical protein
MATHMLVLELQKDITVPFFNTVISIGRRVFRILCQQPESCYSEQQRGTDMDEEAAKFDFTSALKAIRDGKPLTGESGILIPLIKALTEAALEGELDSHLGREISANRRNGKSQKTIKSLDGNFELRTPRDRDGTFTPQLVKKHQTSLNDEIRRKIITMYGVVRCGLEDSERQ